MSFWNGVSGKAEDAFLPEMSVIPNNTQAPAQIKSISVVETNTQYAGNQKFVEVVYKLVSGEFKTREVKQKIKVFTGDSQQIQRARNMLKLLMDICGHELTHDNEPVTQDFTPMTGKIVGVKVREWQIEKNDGSGVMEGNFVAEIHKVDDKFVTETGVKLAAKSPKPSNQYAMDVPNIADSESDLPF